MYEKILNCKEYIQDSDFVQEVWFTTVAKRKVKDASKISSKHISVVFFDTELVFYWKLAYFEEQIVLFFTF